MTKQKGLKNYIILIVIFLLGIGITIYLCNWYRVYNEYQKQTPVIRGMLSEITSEELEHFILENPTITIYMCTSSNDICRNYEKQLKRLVSNQMSDLTDSVIYLNLSDVGEDYFVSNFNQKYPYRVQLTTNYPAFVTFEDGKVKYILQGSQNKPLTITKTKQYFELNHIGE